jgi:hypothetical protein
MSDQFTGADVDLLEEALSLHPDLLVVAIAAKEADQRLAYPITSVEALRGIFGGRSDVTVGDQTYVPQHLDDFVPPEFFPITSRLDLMQKLALVLQRGRLFHHYERQHAPPTGIPQVTSRTTVIPSPAAGPASALRNHPREA